MGMRRTVQNRNKFHNILGVFVGFVLGCFVTSRVKLSLFTGEILSPMTCVMTKNSMGNVNVSLDTLQFNKSVAGKNLIFVGVMTAQKYLDSRAYAVYETWAKTLPGQIAFFSSTSSTTTYTIPLIRLPGVDDSYPPQKKSFLMLKYIHDHFLDEFEWFMRADDDVYIRGDKLELFLRSLNSSRPHFIGQAGMGNKEEFGQLSLEEDENFCMGGPGMILSRETLRKVIPHVKYCLKHLFSTHEDVEVGRCVRKFAGIPCTWSYEMQTIFYHNSSGSEAFTGKLRNKEVHRAFTLHPVKNPPYLYRLHNYMQSLHVQELQQHILLSSRDIHDSTVVLKDNLGLIPNLFINHDILGKRPSLNKFIPNNNSEIILWDFFTKVMFSEDNANPKRRMESPLKEALEDVVTQVMEMINKYSQQRGRVIEFKEILYGYKRIVPSYGADYILDMLLVYKKYRGRKMTIPVRRHAYLQQSFTPLQMREVEEGFHSLEKSYNMLNILEQLNHLGLERTAEESTNFPVDDKIIHFILPLAERYSTFQRFMLNYENNCLINNEKVKLVVVIFKTGNESQFHQSVTLLKNTQKKYPESFIKMIIIQTVFSRALALELGAAQFTENALLFFVDVDIYFTRPVLERIRLNVIKNYQVYYPIVFSQFDPFIAHDGVPVPLDYIVLNEDTGYWRQYGFGIVAIYKSDLTAIGSFDTSIQGWGREDVDLYEKVLHSNLTIFRAAEPGLIHIFHSIECDHDLNAEQYEMCMGTRASSYGSQHKLANLVYQDIMSQSGSFNL